MSRSRQYNMTDACLPQDLRLGFVHLKSAHTLPLEEVNITISECAIWLAFYGTPQAPWNGMSFASIGMFCFPKGRAEFDERVEFFGKERKKWARLPEGVKFDPTMFAVRQVPCSWKHDAFPQSGRSFVHLYDSSRHAMILRFGSRAGTMLDHPLLKRIHQDLRIVENQWNLTFPELQPRKSSRELVIESPLEPKVVSEVSKAVTRAREFLGFKRERSANVIMTAIFKAIEDHKKEKGRRSKATEALAIDLGALWGQTLCQAAQWQWCSLKKGEDVAICAVCSPNRARAINPVGFVHSLLASRRRADENTSLLLFNMIVAGRLPETTPGSYAWLS
jgi:hypothetical protein